MSYVLKVVMLDASPEDAGNGRHDQHTVQHAIVETFDWGPEQTDPISGHLTVVDRTASPRAFRVNIERDLADDLDLLKRTESDEPDLERALVAVFRDELRDRDIEIDLAVRGLRIDSVTIDRDYMKPEEVEELKRAEAAWKPRGFRRHTEQDDLIGYARTLARKGQEAERGWPPAAVQAYEETARAVLKGKIDRIVQLSDGEELAPLARVLEETLTYAKAISS